MRFTFYFLDDRAVVFRRVELECESEEDAVSQVMGLAEGHAMEIWRGGGQTSRFEPIF